VDERRRGQSFLADLQLYWHNTETAECVLFIRARPEAVVDFHSHFVNRPDAPSLLEPDGVHPSVRGQQELARAVALPVADR
jgi:lysophospholipase L1-like esterase